jgi:3-oxoacyl-(acyl-carrier-protein) synthase
VCAGRALVAAGLSGRPLGERVGLYLAVGYIPFQEVDIGPVLDASMEDGRFSMRRFAEGGYQRAHPLLTFKCLPNMPAYHVSVNFDLQGPYFVTYPGPGQLYTALEEAVAGLCEGHIDIALVGGVAHQRNFLVEHHFRRIEPPVPAERLRDAGAMMVLETEERARERGATVRGRLESLSLEYGDGNGHGDGDGGMEYGPASLPLALGMAWDSPSGADVHHVVAGRDGILGKSKWSRVT